MRDLTRTSAFDEFVKSTDAFLRGEHIREVSSSNSSASYLSGRGLAGNHLLQ
jgi:hypothetical protein